MVSELRPELLILHFLQILKIDFIFNWSNHCKAVSLDKELFDHSPDSIFLLDSITVSLLRLECTFKILFLAYLISLIVMKPKTEISNNPEELWKVFLDVLGDALPQNFRFNLKLL